MKRILFIAYYFPPMGGAGVQRALKFAKYLPEYGWQPHILTAKAIGGPLDQGLEKEIPVKIPITRTQILQLPRWLPWRIRNFISRWFLIVDEQIGWLPFAVSKGLQIIKENHVEMIYSTSAPYTSHLIANRLHQMTQIPWVADFRDLWVGNPYLKFPSPLHRKLAEHLERWVVQEASQVVVVSPPMSQAISDRIPGLPRSRLSYIPNGFDSQDFINVRPANRELDRFYLVYTGSFYARRLTARPILEAVHSALKSGQIPRQKLRLRLVGNIGKFTLRWISELNLSDVVEAPGYVSHEQSIACLLAADVLLLVIGSATNSSSVFTGKIFEYLAAAKPILCLADEGVAADLIRSARAGIVVPANDVQQIAQCLVDLYQKWEHGDLSIEPDKNLIQQFERQRITGQLADIFNKLAGKINV